MISLLDPALANERAADVEGYCWASEAQGERERTMIFVAIPAPSEPERLALRVRQAWWIAHYNGRPSRNVERDLALMRAIATLNNGEAREVVRKFIIRAMHK